MKVASMMVFEAQLCLLGAHGFQPAIGRKKQRMAKEPPQRPMTAGFASVKGKVSISFIRLQFYAGAIFRWESRYQRLRFCPLGYEYVIWRGCVFRTNEKQVTHFAQTL